MAFLLDSNVFIQAKNEYYGFDICPGFWEFIDAEAASGSVLSIARVKGELVDYGNELAEWARGRNQEFFLPEPEGMETSVRRVTDWVQAADFRDAAKREFFDSTDQFLIAHALHEGHTVVTHEVHVEGERRRVKIPTVCRAVGVPHVRTFEFIRERGAIFRLQPPATR